MRLSHYLVLAAAAFAGLTGCSDDKPLPPQPVVVVTDPPPPPIPTVAVPVAPVTQFGDGKYEVGTDIVPGQYKTPGAPSGVADKCYWARLKDFSGSLRSSLSMGYGNKGPDVVVIEPSDKGFETRACGVWTRVSK